MQVSIDATGNNSEIPTEQELFERAQALVPVLRERAAATEKNGRISDDVAQMLRDAGFYNILMPVRVGGYGMKHSVLWKMAREVGRGCASTGWTLGLVGLSPWMVGLFPAKAQDDVFGDNNPMVPVMTGGVQDEYDVIIVEGGYEISGLWFYASGIDVGKWAIVMAPTPTGDPSAPFDSRVFLVPIELMEINHDSWDVIGMRGTGSKMVKISKAFVPDYRSISWSAAQNGEFPGHQVNDGPLYQMPLNALFSMSVVAPIAGAAAGAADAVLDLLKKRYRGGTGQNQRDEIHSQIEIGQNVAMMDMAFSMLISDAEEMYAIVERGRPFTVMERTKYRVHCSMISKTFLQAADKLFELTGGAMIRSGTPAERYFRDLHAMTTHFLMQADVTGEMYGRLLLGLDLPDGARI